MRSGLLQSVSGAPVACRNSNKGYTEMISGVLGIDWHFDFPKTFVGVNVGNFIGLIWKTKDPGVSRNIFVVFVVLPNALFLFGKPKP